MPLQISSLYCYGAKSKHDDLHVSLEDAPDHSLRNFVTQ
jgi:hypothetical protein